MTQKQEKMYKMAKANLESVEGYDYNTAKLEEACAAESIPEGAYIMSQGAEKMYYENGNYVVKNKAGEAVNTIPGNAMSTEQQDKLFCIWAGNQAKN